MAVPATYNFFDLLVDAAARADLPRLQQFKARAGHRFCLRSDRLGTLLAVYGTKQSTSERLASSVEEHAKICNGIVDFVIAGLDDKTKRLTIEASLVAAQGGSYPLAARALLQARLDKLPLLKMPRQLAVERAIKLFGGSVSGTCPICLEAVDSTNFYTYDCLCQSVLHSTCMARCVGTDQNMKCPTCRLVMKAPKIE
jgi:hypothetical protein